MGNNGLMLDVGTDDTARQESSVCITRHAARYASMVRGKVQL